ncbi:MAG TPA: type II toxin-antitoxin system HigB family toxin [Burkholderiales bacterium]|nr:type II toxin-antitoxin system HigB family toxin [Burkholderiales bacterium]
MRIVGREMLHAFAASYADVRGWIEAWIAETERVRWLTPQDIKARFASASFLPDNVVVLNVKGNRYRLEIKVAYQAGVVIVRHIETHAQYTKRMRK